MKRVFWLLLLVSCSSGPEPDVNSSHPYGRYLGALELGKSSGAESVRKLIHLLEDPDYLARSGAVVALGQKGDPEFSQHLIPMLSSEKEPSGLVRSDVCISLGLLGGADVVDPLLDTLKSDEDPVVRREAARALSAYKREPRVVLGLLRALVDSDASVAWRAEVSLGLKGTLSEEALRFIFSGRESEEERVRAGVAEAIALTGQAVLAERLLPIEDPSSSVRSRICRSLGRLRNPATQEALLETLRRDKEAPVRAAAARGLSHFERTPSLLEGLLDALEDSSPLVRAQAHQALILLTGAMDMERNRDAWSKYLKEKS